MAISILIKPFACHCPGAWPKAGAEDKEYPILRKVRESVDFAAQNLVGDAPFSGLNLIPSDVGRPIGVLDMKIREAWDGDNGGSA